MSVPIQQYSHDDLGEVGSLIEELFVGVDYNEQPRHYMLLVRLRHIVHGYERMLAALHAIYNIPGRQMAGLPWLATLQTHLKEVLG